MFKKKPKEIELMNEITNKEIICPIFQLTDEIINYVKQFNNSDEFLRKGGLSTDMLDRLAFGFADIDITTLNPSQLSVKWKDDLENVKYQIQKSRLNPKVWASKVDLTEPIDVSYEKNKFFIEDGHHRFTAAKILNKPLNVNLEIKDNPIIRIAPKLGYDDVMRCIFKQVNEKESLNETINYFNNKPYYHGGDEIINKFTKTEPKNRISNIEGFYFTDNINIAKKYGNKITTVYLTIQNPFYIHKTIPNEKILEKYKELLIKENPNVGIEWIDEKVEFFIKNKIIYPTGMTGENLKNCFIAGGYDSVIDGFEICVFNENNIIYNEKKINENVYPLETKGNWYGDEDYESRGGKLVYMTPDEFLSKTPTLKIDDSSRDNIDDLKQHILSGRKLDPLALYSTDKTNTRNSDGRHRAIAAKELGINKIPVLVFEKQPINEATNTIDDFYHKSYLKDNLPPALLTWDEYFDKINGEHKSHPDSAYNRNVDFTIQVNPEEKGYKLVKNQQVGKLLLKYYTKKTLNEYVKRNENGDYIGVYSEQEMIERGLSPYDVMFLCLHDNYIVGEAKDEWGCTLIQVGKEYRNLGIGETLIKLYREIYPNKTSGGFTYGGYQQFKKYYNWQVNRFLASGIYSEMVKNKEISLDRVKAIVGSRGTEKFSTEKTNKLKDVYGGNNEPIYWISDSTVLIFDSSLKNINDLHDINDVFLKKLIYCYLHIVDFNGYPQVYACYGDEKYIQQAVALMSSQTNQDGGLGDYYFRNFDNNIKTILNKIWDNTKVYDVITLKDKGYIKDVPLRLIKNKNNLSGMINALKSKTKSFFKSFDKYGEIEDRILEVTDGFINESNIINESNELQILSPKNNILQKLGITSGRLFNKKGTDEINKEIESNYVDDMSQHFNREKNDIRLNAFNYEHPLMSTQINNVELRVAEGLIRNNKKTYLLYANGVIIGEFYNTDDIKKLVRFIREVVSQKSLNESNSQLEGTYIKITSPNIKKHIDFIISKYGDEAEVMKHIKESNNEGKPEYSISYTYCKKLISISKNLNKKHTDNNKQFELYGGFPLLHYLTNQLNSKRNSIETRKEVNKMAGLKNQFRKSSNSSLKNTDTKRYFDNQLRECIELINESEENNQQTIKEASCAVVINSDKKLLLLKRGEGTTWQPNKWALVGGKIEKDETPEDAVVRECKEETQLDIFNLTYCYTIKEDKVNTNFFIGFTDNNDVKLNGEHSEFKWVSPNEITELDTVPNLLKEIKKCFEVFDENEEEVINESIINNYIYHGTGKGQALNIQRDGYMKPNNTGEEHPSISFTDNLDYAKYYAKSKGGTSKMCILRTRLTNDYQLSPRIRNNKGDEYITFKKIPSSELEVLTPNNDWVNLDKWDVIFDEPFKLNEEEVINENNDILTKKFNKLNKEYIKLEKQQDKTTYDIEYRKISEKLEEIQNEMSVISSKLENNTLNEEMSSSQGLALYHPEDADVFVLYNPKTISNALKNYDTDEAANSIYGIIELRYNETYKSYEVERITANKGFGPIMYLTALQYAGKDGLMPTRIKEQVTDQAKNVWKQFYDGIGSKYCKSFDLINPEDNTKNTSHEEEYLNKKYVLNKTYNDYNKMINNSKMFLRNDRYGEYGDMIWNTGDEILTNKMRSIYQN